MQKKLLTPAEMLELLISYSASKHLGQYDKGGVPYILHPLNVMMSLDTKDFELMCICIGHDLKEDCDVTDKDLYDLGMSRRVVVGIENVTHHKLSETYEEYKTKVLSTRDSCRVKLQDITHNSLLTRLKGVTSKDFARMQQYNTFYLEIEQRLLEFS